MAFIGDYLYGYVCRLPTPAEGRLHNGGWDGGKHSHTSNPRWKASPMKATCWMGNNMKLHLCWKINPNPPWLIDRGIRYASLYKGYPPSKHPPKEHKYSLSLTLRNPYWPHICNCFLWEIWTSMWAPWHATGSYLGKVTPQGPRSFLSIGWCHTDT